MYMKNEQKKNVQTQVQQWAIAKSAYVFSNNGRKPIFEVQCPIDYLLNLYEQVCTNIMSVLTDSVLFNSMPLSTQELFLYGRIQLNREFPSCEAALEFFGLVSFAFMFMLIFQALLKTLETIYKTFVPLSEFLYPKRW